MTTFRIYTEDVNREQVLHAASERFPAYNWTRANGVWNNQSEDALVIEVSGDGRKLSKLVRSLAQFIKALNRQEAVLITRTPITQVLI